ncbi:HAD-IA family hydrolase [Xanthomonas sp. LMG 12461]|uniref:HAD-IA family hydrolase n=1 Tax=Xanthomonas sp. LMG 12461 TaxID=2014543 RepID=UPI001D03980A|nr:HAD-IA family hydrolase [Xanthomonas sp. LMG 12461]
MGSIAQARSAVSAARALLVDMDGVLRLWPDDDAALERAHGVPPGSLRAVAFAPALLEPAIRGATLDAQWRAEVAARLAALAHGADVAALVDAWSAPTAARLNPPVLALLRQVRQRMPVVLLSNATSRLSHDLQALGIADAFDAVVNSSEVGAIKPEPAIFLHALARLGVKADAALIVDDATINVDAACALGLRAEGYVDAEALRAWLLAHGALHAATDRRAKVGVPSGSSACAYFSRDSVMPATQAASGCARCAANVPCRVAPTASLSRWKLAPTPKSVSAYCGGGGSTAKYSFENPAAASLSASCPSRSGQASPMSR